MNATRCLVFSSTSAVNILYLLLIPLCYPTDFLEQKIVQQATHKAPLFNVQNMKFVNMSEFRKTSKICRAPPAPYVAIFPHEDSLVFTYNSAKVISQYANIAELFRFLAAAFANVVHDCAYHGIALRSQAPLHKHVAYCDESISRPDSEYRGSFLKVLQARTNTVCRRCWCPPVPAFHHSAADILDSLCPRGRYEQDWLDWWCVLPYTIFRIPLLRSTIFQELAIDENIFESNLRKYAIWLNLPASRNTQVTNLVILTCTYFQLLQSGCLSLPTGGYKLDRKCFLFLRHVHSF